jgi:SIR2-like domain
MTSAVSAELTFDDEDLLDHCLAVVTSLFRGSVTPILGAGASLYGRPQPASAPVPDGESGDGDAPGGWNGAPSAAELAAMLAREFRVRVPSNDLLHIAQWIYAVRNGTGDLYKALHDVFKQDFPPTGLHAFLAEVPGKLRAAGKGRPQLILTTNYDDLIERALDAAQEDYDVLVYMADGPHEGQFCHVRPGKALTPITSADYLEVDPDERTVVLKMHGFVDRQDPPEDSYVITEDHYIEYLARLDLRELLPARILKRLLDTHLLFLGYSLRDWNFRAILHQIHEKAIHENAWWAVQLKPDRLERKSWEKRRVEIIDISLEEYIPALAQVLDHELSAPTDRA